MAAVSLSDHGPLDLVVDTGVLNVFQGDGKANFTPTGSYGSTGSPLLLADVNGDGKQDLIGAGTNTTLYFPRKQRRDISGRARRAFLRPNCRRKQ